jgi:LysM repeat protein
MRTWTSLIAALILALGLLAAPEASAQANTHVVRAGETLFAIARQHGTTVAEIRRLNNLTGDTIRTGQRLVVRGAAAPAPAAPAAPPPAPAPPPQQPEEPALRPADPLPPGPRPRYDTGESLGAPPPDLVRPDPIPTGPPPPPPPPATLTRVAIGAGALQPFPNEPVVAAGGGGVHVVASGETLFALAQQYGTSVGAIRQANALAGDGLAVGQRLVIPGGGGAAAPAPAAPSSGRYVVTRTTVADDEVHAVLPGETLFSVAARYGTTVGRVLALNAIQSGPLAPGTMLVLPDGVGRQYHRQPAEPRVDEQGLALVYPASYAGRPTISGEPYDATALTASHRTLPFGTMLLVTAPETGRRTLVRVNDRGPVSEGFLIELSAAAAEALGLQGGSAQRVSVQVLR